jgi:hypothetical protein
MLLFQETESLSREKFNNFLKYKSFAIKIEEINKKITPVITVATVTILK